jgi:hypothetical protein
MSTVPPSWSHRNLARHHAQRLRDNPGCFEDLLGINGRTMTAEEYRDQSLRTVAASWCEYEAQGRDFQRGTYFDVRAYHVDDDLVVSITDQSRSQFVTCFHEHFDDRRPLHGGNPGRGVSVAQRRIRYQEDLRRKEKGRVLINLKVIRDGQL